MRFLLHPLCITALATTTSLANTVLQTKPNSFVWNSDNEHGFWRFQSVKLNDPPLYINGSPIKETMVLKSVSVIHDTEINSRSTPAQSKVWLCILEKKLGINSLVAHSNEPLEVTKTPEGSVITWQFPTDTVLSTSKHYYYTFFADNNNGKFDPSEDFPTLVRLEASKKNVHSGSPSLKNANVDVHMRFELAPYTPTVSHSSSTLVSYKGLEIQLSTNSR